MAFAQDALHTQQCVYSAPVTPTSLVEVHSRFLADSRIATCHDDRFPIESRFRCTTIRRYVLHPEMYACTFYCCYCKNGEKYCNTRNNNIVISLSYPLFKSRCVHAQAYQTHFFQTTSFSRHRGDVGTHYS